ncbi:MAG TPA: glycosyltransferase family 4 protein [Flavipsychrobacter sp.]|nr:glycosyltransferase family 4 protein [Flavipsychrobacter sp.]
MKILMVLVGEPLFKDPPKDEEFYLYRRSLHDGEFYYFLKHAIVNSDSQMQSLLAAGVDLTYGYITNTKNPKRLLKLARQIKRIVREEGVDIVHVMWGNALGLTTALASSVPTVLSLCGSDLLGNYNSKLKKTLKGRIAGFLSQFAALFSKNVITKSQHMKSRLWAPSKNKTFVLPNGINLSKFYTIDKVEARKKIGWEQNKPIVIFFYTPGQFVKNEPLALKTFDKLKEQLPDCELKILTKIPHEQLVYYYNAADVMLLVSKHEGSNNSLKEALACNLPIVSTPCGDAPERLENVKNCYISKGWDPEELAGLLLQALKKNERSNGRDRAQSISNTEIQKRLVEIYQQLEKNGLHN